MSYSPTLGRWMEQDPLRYIDGLNSYLDEADAPASKLDSQGLTSADDDDAFNTVVGARAERTTRVVGSTAGGETSDGSQVATPTYETTTQYYAYFADGHKERITPDEAKAYQDELAQAARGGQAAAYPPTPHGVPRLGAATTQAAATQPTSSAPRPPGELDFDRWMKANGEVFEAFFHWLTEGHWNPLPVAEHCLITDISMPPALLAGLAADGLTSIIGLFDPTARSQPSATKAIWHGYLDFVGDAAWRFRYGHGPNELPPQKRGCPASQPAVPPTTPPAAQYPNAGYTIEDIINLAR